MEMINRRIPNIIVPLNKISEDLLLKNIDSREGLYYTLPISREDLDILQEHNFFEKINERFNINIDEYEEEIIEIDLQKKILEYLNKISSDECFVCDFYRNKIIIFLTLSMKLEKRIFIYF